MPRIDVPRKTFRPWRPAPAGRMSRPAGFLAAVFLAMVAGGFAISVDALPIELVSLILAISVALIIVLIGLVK